MDEPPRHSAKAFSKAGAVFVIANHPKEPIGKAQDEPERQQHGVNEVHAEGTFYSAVQTAAGTTSEQSCIL
jgi:hypothetical protein